MNKTPLILIDGSYFIFHRYYALLAWYKIAKKEIPEDPSKCPEFIEKFRTSFPKKIKELLKKLKIKNKDDCYIMVAKDCPRNNIWRNKHTTGYKATRDYSNFHGKPFFKMAYDELFENSGVYKILYQEGLEADDCIALVIKEFRENYSDVFKPTIITADHDYMQLIEDDISIMTLKYKDIRTPKNSTMNCKCDLFLKIILGDKSDNIEPVFSRCGKKTALELWNDKKKFLQKLKDENCIEKYQKNQKIIDFRFIPKKLQIEFYKNNIIKTEKLFY